MAEMEGSRRDQPTVKPREKIQKLVEVTAEFPEKLPKRIAAIVKRVEPFEDLAKNSMVSVTAGLDLNSLMEVDGVLTPDLVDEIESGGKILRAYLEKAKRETLMGTKSQDALNRFTRRVDINMNGILARLAKDNRPIATRYIYEMMQYAFLQDITDKILTYGYQKVAEAYRDGSTIDTEQRDLVNTAYVADLLTANDAAPQHTRTHHEAFALLRDSAHDATEVEIPLRGFFFGGKPVRADIVIFEDQTALIVGILRLSNADTGEPILPLAISRITGELLSAGMHMASARSAFEALGKGALYAQLRDAALTGFLQAIEQGQIVDRPYVTFDTPITPDTHHGEKRPKCRRTDRGNECHARKASKTHHHQRASTHVAAHHADVQTHWHTYRRFLGASKAHVQCVRLTLSQLPRHRHRALQTRTLPRP